MNDTVMSKIYGMKVVAGVIVAAVLLGACGGSADDPEAKKPLAAIDAGTAGSISGTVLFKGTPPAPKPINQEADPMCRLVPETQAPIYTQDVVVENGRLANVFVYLSDGVKGRYAPPAEPAVIDQRGCRYSPHVMGIMAGQALTIRNSDSTLHNIHAGPQKNDGFNLAQTQVGQTSQWTFTHTEVMIPVSCDVHGWMRSYIGVLTHPFFAVTGTDGAFNISGVPPGTYTMTAWHEKYGTQQATVTVTERGAASATFTFVAP